MKILISKYYPKIYLIILILSLLIISGPISAASFIHPYGFKETPENKAAVINYIKEKVKDQYCNSGIDMCDSITLRMMEKQNLNAFKKLTKAPNKEILDRVIKDYCNSGLDMCDYITIKMMYDQNQKAANEELEW